MTPLTDPRPPNTESNDKEANLCQMKALPMWPFLFIQENRGYEARLF